MFGGEKYWVSLPYIHGCDTPMHAPLYIFDIPAKGGGRGKISALLGFWGRILVPATTFSVVFKGFWTVF